MPQIMQWNINYSVTVGWSVSPTEATTTDKIKNIVRAIVFRQIFNGF